MFTSVFYYCIFLYGQHTLIKRGCKFKPDNFMRSFIMVLPVLHVLRMHVKHLSLFYDL